MYMMYGNKYIFSVKPWKRAILVNEVCNGSKSYIYSKKHHDFLVPLKQRNVVPENEQQRKNENVRQNY